MCTGHVMCMGYVMCMEEARASIEICAENVEGKTLFERPAFRFEDNIKCALRYRF